MIDIQPEDQAVFDRLRSTGRINQSLRKMITQQWNRCVSCQKPVAAGRPLFAGYDLDAKSLVVDARCAAQLIELASPIYWSDALDLSIPNTQVVWRYMDFAKFALMLKQGGLYFARADTFDDAFEGAAGLSRREGEWDNHYLAFFREAVTTPPPGHPTPDLSDEEVEDRAKDLLRQIKSSTSIVRNQLISCWHANELESEALWRLYCTPPIPGIAVQSTVSQLWDACAESMDARVGRVHYLDFRKSFASVQMERIFQKRKSLSHEREVRIVLPNDRNEPRKGLVLSCDLSALVSKIVVSPFAPPWFHEVVTSTIAKFGYAFEVGSSELLDQPFY